MADEGERPEEQQPKRWTRRVFLGAGAVTGGGLLLGVGGVIFAPNRLKYVLEGARGDGNLTTWIRMSPDSRTTVLIPHCEMGQGTLTGLGMLLVEELDADWSRCNIEQAPAEDVYANGYVVHAFLEEFGVAVPESLERLFDFGSFKMAEFVGMQVTGGSTSTRGTGQFGMRLAGATARAMLLEAGAREFGVPEDELTARDSRIAHAASGRSAKHGELAPLAATLDLPRRPTLKTREQSRLVGSSQDRADIPGKVVGEAQYGIDVVLPDMLYATIMRAPVPGGQLEGVDPVPAEAMAGVHEVVQLPDAVAVVADGYWYARQALNALEPTFTDDGAGDMDTAAIRAAHVAALDQEALDEASDAGRTVTAEHGVPYLAHATTEPMCATVRLADGRCEVWAGTQDPRSTRGVASDVAGLDRDDVDVYNQPLGGGSSPGRTASPAAGRTGWPRPRPTSWRRRRSGRFHRRSISARAPGARSRPRSTASSSSRSSTSSPTPTEATPSSTGGRSWTTSRDTGRFSSGPRRWRDGGRRSPRVAPVESRWWSRSDPSWRR